MSWLRLDDAFDTHPKVLELTEQERWRWTRVLLHCARHRTDGHIASSVLRDIGLARSVQKLVDVNLLLETSANGDYLVNDWEVFNPKDPTKTERQARWRASKASTEASTGRRRVDGDVDGSVDGQGVYSRVGARARPVPSLKESSSKAVDLHQPAPARPNGTAQGLNMIGETIDLSMATARKGAA